MPDRGDPGHRSGMPYHMDHWDWLWMVQMMLAWVIVLGVVIYFAVRLGNEHSRHDAP